MTHDRLSIDQNNHKQSSLVSGEDQKTTVEFRATLIFYEYANGKSSISF